jgi:hypothetical protein
MIPTSFSNLNSKLRLKPIYSVPTDNKHINTTHHLPCVLWIYKLVSIMVKHRLIIDFYHMPRSVEVL